MAHARRQVLRQHPQPPADLEDDVVRLELGGRADDAQQVVVDEEVLAQLSVGPDVELPQTSQARLAGLGRHHPKTRAAFDSTSASSSS